MWPAWDAGGGPRRTPGLVRSTDVSLSRGVFMGSIRLPRLIHKAILPVFFLLVIGSYTAAQVYRRDFSEGDSAC